MPEQVPDPHNRIGTRVKHKEGQPGPTQLVFLSSEAKWFVSRHSDADLSFRVAYWVGVSRRRCSQVFDYQSAKSICGSELVRINQPQSSQSFQSQGNLRGGLLGPVGTIDGDGIQLRRLHRRHIRSSLHYRGGSPPATRAKHGHGYRQRSQH